MYVFFCTLDFIEQACSFSSSFTYSNVIYTISKCENWRGKIGYATFWCKKFVPNFWHKNLNNTCTIHFICQRFNLWCLLWLWLYAILVFTSDRNPSAMSLEVWDFRVLTMNILCLFQCPCLTRTTLAFKKPLSELSGKWCSHAMGLFWAFGIFSSYAEVKCMQGWWQIGVPQQFWSLVPSAPLHRISWPKWSKNSFFNRWLLGTMARQMQQQRWAPVHEPISLFRSLCNDSGFPAAQRHFPTGLSKVISSCQKSLFSWISIFWLERNSNCFCSL